MRLCCCSNCCGTETDGQTVIQTAYRCLTLYAISTVSVMMELIETGRASARWYDTIRDAILTCARKPT